MYPFKCQCPTHPEHCIFNDVSVRWFHIYIELLSSFYGFIVFHWWMYHYVFNQSLLTFRLFPTFLLLETMLQWMPFNMRQLKNWDISIGLISRNEVIMSHLICPSQKLCQFTLAPTIDCFLISSSTQGTTNFWIFANLIITFNLHFSYYKCDWTTFHMFTSHLYFFFINQLLIYFAYLYIANPFSYWYIGALFILGK